MECSEYTDSNIEEIKKMKKRDSELLKKILAEELQKSK
jgi:hypothetical protein